MNKRISLFFFAFLICTSFANSLKSNILSINALNTNNLRTSEMVDTNKISNGTVSVTLKYISSTLSGDDLEVKVDIDIKNLDNCSYIPIVCFTYNSKDIPQKEIDDAILKSNNHINTCSGGLMLNFKIHDNFPDVYYIYFGVLNSDKKVEGNTIIQLNKPPSKSSGLGGWDYCVIALTIFAFLMVVGLIGWTIFYCRKRKQNTTQESKGNIGESLLKSNSADSDDD